MDGDPQENYRTREAVRLSFSRLQIKSSLIKMLKARGHRAVEVSSTDVHVQLIIASESIAKHFIPALTGVKA